MKKIVFLIVLAAGLQLNANAQYKTAVGLRLGFSQGVDFKFVLGERFALDALVSSRGPEGAVGLTIRLLEQKSLNDLFGVTKGSFTWFYGIGSHLASYGKLDANKYEGLGSGLDGGVGVEYDFAEIPFTLVLDYRMILDIGLKQHIPWLLQDAGVTLRYKLN